MIESVKERIALMKDIIAMREDDAETEVNKDVQVFHAHMTDEKAWNRRRIPDVDSETILMHSSPVTRSTCSEMSGEFDLDFRRLGRLRRETVDMLTSETADMNSQFKGSPFDYQSGYDRWSKPPNRHK